MNTLTLKVHEYDAESHTISVSFVTDDLGQSVNDAPRYVYAVQNYNPDDMDDTIKQIAMQGAFVAFEQLKRIRSMNNETHVNNAQSVVGRVYNFDIADLIKMNVVEGGAHISGVTAI
jgi:hypothetical protein